MFYINGARANFQKVPDNKTRKANRGFRQNGFTLLEMLIVLLILGIILGMALPRYGSTVKLVKDETNSANLAILDRAVRLYYLDIGIYPERLEDLISGRDAPGWQGPYLEEIPEYPYNSNLHYQINQQGKIFIQ